MTTPAVDADSLARPWSAVPPDIAALIQPYLDEVADDIINQVVRQVPEYADGAPHTQRVVDYALHHFTELLTDPDASWEQLIALMREIGGAEAAAGRSLNLLESTNRSVMQLVWQRIVGESEAYGLSNETLSLLLESIVTFIGVITDAAEEGHLQVGAEGEGELQPRRRLLLRELLGDEPITDERLEPLAHAARWPIPSAVAFVALQPPLAGTDDGRPEFPAELLADLDRGSPCLLLPDPDAAGRIDELRGMLRGWRAVVGPAVRPHDAARSRRWAAEALTLVRCGALPDDPVVRCVDHVPTMVIFHAQDLLDTAAARRLGPFLELSAPVRERLSETLLTLLRCHFNATKAAKELNVHPQTVRLRLQRLEEIFGTELQNRDNRLEMQMLLYSALSKTSPSKN
jgi:hypothetical protein